jgi:uncharacterized lipoprotein
LCNHDGLTESQVDWDAMTKGEKMDAVTRQAKRMEAQRLKDMYGYFADQDESGWTGPSWCTRPVMFKALIGKTPWQAAWDRLMRILVR